MFSPHHVSRLFELTAAWPMVLLDASIKGALLLAAAALLMRLLRRAPAALRHLTAVLTMTGLVLLPLLSVALPAWRVPVFSAASHNETDPRRNVDGERTFPQASAFSARPPVAGTDDPSNPRNLPLSPRRESVATGSSGQLMHGWPFWLVAIWLLGAGAVLVRLAAGIYTVHRLIRSGLPIEESQSAAMFRSVLQQLGLRRRIRLIGSQDIRMPMTTGILQPAVLLPLDEDWSSRQCRLVLTHELAHVKRWDCLTDRLMQFGCALYWFHPLVWLLARRAHLERERACDDLVLTLGGKPSDYADVLLHFARPEGRGSVPRAALGTASLSSLERRLTMILDSAQQRRPATRRAVVIGLAVLLLAVVPLAALRLTAQAADPPEKLPAENKLDPQKPANEKQAEGKAFGPVIERVVEDDRPEWKFLIDLDTGKVSALPKEVQKQDDFKKLLEWARRQGIDAMGEGSEGLYGITMIARPIDGPIAQKFPDDLPMPMTARMLKQLVEVGDPGTPIPITARGGKLPETFLFATSDGGKGVLQIVEFTDDPSGVKIRYRLLKDGREAK